LLYGVDGVGKSTFAAKAPDPIFIGVESGTDNLDISRLTPRSWGDIVGTVDELATTKHEYKTLVVDSLDWAEPLLNQMICERYGVKSIELAAGGYGKGYGEAVSEWVKLCRSLTAARAAGMNIILIAHSTVVKFNDPQTQTEYDRFELKLYKKSSAIMREFVDSVLFCNFEIYSKKDGQKTQHYGDGARVIHTERRPGFDAKTRFTMPATIPLSWDDYDRAVMNGGDVNPDKIRAAILEAADGIVDAELKKAVLDATEKAGKNADTLEAIRNRLVIRLGEQT
jgi:hypothetical protein